MQLYHRGWGKYCPGWTNLDNKILPLPSYQHLGAFVGHSKTAFSMGNWQFLTALEFG